jgi:hypothetical protein
MRITALFDAQRDAEAAITELRSNGLRDDQLSIVSSHAGDGMNEGAIMNDDGKKAAEGAGKGLAAGVGVGALFGIAAALIPGVGPFITAGALAATLGSSVAGGAVAGAAVGGAVGSLAGAFARAGYDKDEADYYGNGVERGGVLVAVDAEDSMMQARARDILSRHHGQMRGMAASGMASSSM